MELTCKRCKREWKYTGSIRPVEDYPQYTSCPRCKSSIRVQEKEE